MSEKDKKVIRLAVEAYRAAASKTEAQLHAPNKEWPDGFHSSDDADIIAEAGMTAAARVILDHYLK